MVYTKVTRFDRPPLLSWQRDRRFRAAIDRIDGRELPTSRTTPWEPNHL
jgi:hypothetical protein